jgi:hypothetical protein
MNRETTMNRNPWAICIVAGVVLGTLAAWAATQRWSYDSAPAIYQIMADGSGGCAYVRRETNSYYAVLWLDKKGTLLHRADVNTNQTPTIVSCTKKQLVYTALQDSWRFVQVMSDGTVTPITAGSDMLTVPFLQREIPVNRTTDHKGFFGVLITMPSSRQTLVRFDNK